MCVQQSRLADRAHNARCLSARARGCRSGHERRGSWPGSHSQLPAPVADTRDRECTSAHTLQTLTLRPSIRENETTISGKFFFQSWKRMRSALFYNISIRSCWRDESYIILKIRFINISYLISYYDEPKKKD